MSFLKAILYTRPFGRSRKRRLRFYADGCFRLTRITNAAYLLKDDGYEHLFGSAVEILQATRLRDRLASQPMGFLSHLGSRGGAPGWDDGVPWALGYMSALPYRND
jgi:hypothetical protein